MASYTSPPSTLALPRILCLHGGGVSAQIFHIQCRPLMSRLEPHFRLVFVDGPLACDMNYNLVPYYGHLAAGCRRWSAWLPEHERHSDAAAVDVIEEALVAAMRDDSDRNGATGDWVGLLGFSQGAKIAMSVLLENQMRADEWTRAQRGLGVDLNGDNAVTSRATSRTTTPTLDARPPLDVNGINSINNLITNNNQSGSSSGNGNGNGSSSNDATASPFAPPAEDLFAGAAWRFGVILAGRAKPFALGCGSRRPSANASSDRRYFDVPSELPEEGTETAAFPRRLRLRTPTLHVHGKRDAGIRLHRQLLRDYTVRGSGRVLEWDEGHRVVVKDPDLARVVEGILETARAAGCLG